MIEEIGEDREMCAISLYGGIEEIGEDREMCAIYLWEDRGERLG